ncbi:MAG TPA: creatininase family protein [Candidatus Thermoplasmatota archaeon]|nr:creatininase family protein [Candidatus Thermoplasmatota archaeon]
MELDSLTFPEFEARVTPRTVVLWPIGIVEEHGPHLPLSTDSLQAEWTCAEVARRTGALVLPPLRYGNAVTTRPFPGTISLSFDTVRAVARDVLRECDRNALRRVVIVSGHAGGGHMRALKVAAEEVLEEGRNMKIAVLSDWDLVPELRRTALANAAPADDGHAGTAETSRVLAIAPDAVRASRPGPSPAKFPEFRVEIDTRGRIPSGVIGGDPSRATAELGRAINEHVASRLAGIVKDLAAED